MKPNQQLSYDDMIQRYTAAFDEIYYIAGQLSARMGMSHEKEIAEDYLKAVMEKAEDMVTDLENIHAEALPE